MSSLIVIHADFEAHWPFVAEQWLARWQAEEPTELIRLACWRSAPTGRNCGRSVGCAAAGLYRCACDVGLCAAVRQLREATFPATYGTSKLSADCVELLRGRGVKLYDQRSEGFWGQSVAEFALALTLNALRRIPQNYHEMLTSHEAWHRYKPQPQPGTRHTGCSI